MTDIWKLEFNTDIILTDYILKNSINSTKLLDLTKKTYTPYEKFIYDSALFHFNRLNIKITENHYVEFWCKATFETHRLHVDCDEYEKRVNNNYIYPLLSCISYFNDNDSPTIITNVDLENYKYKEFETQTELFFSLPKCNKQVTFNGSKYHGSCKLSKSLENEKESRYIIAINLWERKPTNVEYYIPDNDDNELYSRDVSIVDIVSTIGEIKTINVCKNIINYSLFENMLYSNKTDTFYIFKDFIEKEKEKEKYSSFKIVLDLTIEKNKIEISLKNKYGNIIDDINQLNNEKGDVKYNRFLQRFTFKKIYTPEMSRYIINESERYAQYNGGWTVKRHENYPTTDLPVNKIPSIFGLILETMNTICDKVKSSYGLNDDMSINIQDLFIVKYEATSQNYLEMHVDGSFLSFNILLNNPSEFEGGGTYFDDGLTSHSEQGDLLIHSSKIKHSGLSITKGKRYLLVGFLNIELKIEE